MSAGAVACGPDTTYLIAIGPSPEGPDVPSPSSPSSPSGGDGDPNRPISDSPEVEGPGLDEQARAEAFLSLPDQLELVAPGFTLAPAFEQLTFDLPVALVQAPRLGTWFLAELHGRIYAFDDRPDAADKRLVLDLSAYTQGTADCGLIAFAFHPEFAQAGSANAGYIYLLYAYSATPLDPTAPPTTPTLSRLSRFTVDLDTLTVDPSTELVLIDQQDESTWHQGAGMFFHPDDGFLYVSVGDEGSRFCQLGNCQRIDRDLFSGVLRIDVDQRGGSVSHPIPRQPESGTTANYYIPNDNPFVGQADVLEEFYALGLRNPYRMSHDPVDNLVWIGEVGQGTYEEIDILAPGANYQWNVFEGSIRSRGAMPATPLGTWTDPVFELERDDAACIIGGFVYRGQRFPELRGKYVFADYTLSKLYALSYTYEDGRVQAGELNLLIDGVLGKRETITSFGVDAQGELYMLIYGEQVQIQRLQQTDGVTNAPALLSELPAFDGTNAANLTPEPWLLPYDVQAPLWSDGAHKRRWLALPQGSSITFAEQGPWSFPEGTVFVKHFEIALDERAPNELRPLETRFLVAGAGGNYYGLSYKWNEQGTDAVLLLESETEALEIIEVDGSVRQQSYFYPGPADCLTCHTAEAGHVLGVRTAQLNGTKRYEPTGRRANQLVTLSALGMLDADIAMGASHPRLAALDDTSRSAYDRVRSYWDSNCAMCHGVKPEIRAAWDARYETPLEERGLVMAAAFDGGEGYLVVPGDADASLLYQRDSTTDPGLRMPPLGRNRNDEAYLELFRSWIESLPAASP